MSRASAPPGFVPFIALADKAARALRNDMLDHALRAGFDLQPSHNAVFATLPPEGARSADMATRAGVTRQSMGESIRDMVSRGMLEMVPDPTDGRAKIVRYTDFGREVADVGFQHLLDLDERFREELGDEDFETACRVLARVREMLEGGTEEWVPASVDPAAHAEVGRR
jgi:DNA-binding MarR family transcriptional regulator